MFAHLAGLALVAAAAHAATIYKCIDLDAKIAYQDQPCDDIALSTTIEVQVPRPPPLPTTTVSAGSDTPQTAWSEMVRALGAGKVEDAMANVVPEQRATYRQMLSSLDLERAQRFAVNLGTLENVKLNGGDPDTSDAATGMLRTPGGRVSEVRFARLSGRWFVGQF